MHLCIHTLTFIPTYLHTFIPTYLHTFISTYLDTYIYTFIPTYLHTYIALHCITLQYITLPTCMNTCIHTFIVGGCMHCGCTATLDTWTDFANLVEYFAETNSEFREISLFHTKRIFDLYILSLSVHVNII